VRGGGGDDNRKLNVNAPGYNTTVLLVVVSTTGKWFSSALQIRQSYLVRYLVAGHTCSKLATEANSLFRKLFKMFVPIVSKHLFIIFCDRTFNGSEIQEQNGSRSKSVPVPTVS
jgi:hypothetical protein